MESAPCGVCGAAEATLLFRARDPWDLSEERWGVGRCRRCSHTYLLERPTPQEIGRYYPEDYGPHQSRERAGRPRAPARHRLIRIRPPFDILDVGCGTGYDLRPFIAQGCRASGIELDPKAARQARQEGIDVQCSSVESATFPSGTFRVITVNHALEHVFQPRAALANLRRMLRPDGVVYLLFPTAGGLMFRWFRQDWYHLGAPVHLQFFTHATFVRLCRETGLRVLYRGTRSGSKGFFGSLARSAQQGGPGAWAHRLFGLGLARAYAKFVLRYLVDGLRLGDVAEYLLGPSRAPGT